MFTNVAVNAGDGETVAEAMIKREEGEPGEHGELFDALERGIRQLVADKHAGWPLIPVKRLD